MIAGASHAQYVCTTSASLTKANTAGAPRATAAMGARSANREEL
jgi:hypothetical protein